MTKQFIAMGECMIELSGSGSPDLWRMGVAGDTLNTGWYMRHLLGDEWQVNYFTRLGQDPFSQRIVDFLRAGRIGTDYISHDPRLGPGLYAINLHEGERSFTYWRSNSAARGLADDHAQLEQAALVADVLYLSGITLAILPPKGRENLLQAMARAQGRGAMVVFDPNIRLRLWESADVARVMLMAAAHFASIVLPSFDDEAALFGDQTPEETLHRYKQAGCAEIAVKNAGGPVHWLCGQRQGIVNDLPKVRPVDTTGAGDSFNAAYLAARLADVSVEQAIRKGHDLAARVVGHPGALMPL